MFLFFDCYSFQKLFEMMIFEMISLIFKNRY